MAIPGQYLTDEEGNPLGLDPVALASAPPVSPGGGAFVREGDRLVPRAQQQAALNERMGQTAQDIEEAAKPKSIVEEAAPAASPLPPVAPAQPKVETDTTTQTTKSFKQLDPSEAAAVEAKQEAFQQEEGAIRDRAENERQKAIIQAEEAEKSQQLASQIAAEDAARKQQVEAEMKAAAEQFRKDEARARQLAEQGNGGILPFFRDKRAGMEAQVKWALTLSSFGAALSGQSNQALDQYKEALDRDIDQQKAAILNAKDTAKMSRERYDALVTRADSMLEAARATAKETLAAQLAARLKRQGVSDAQIAANTDIAKLRQEAAADRQKFAERKAVDVTRSVMSRTQTTSGGPGAGGPGNAPEGTVFDANGRPLVNVGDKKKAADINDANATFRDLVSTVEQLRDNYAEYGAEATKWSDASQQREALRARALGLLNKQLKFGSLDKGAVEQLAGSLDPGGMDAFFGGGKSKLGTTIKALQDSHKSFLNSQGLPADQFYAPVVQGRGQAAGQPAQGASPAQAPPSAPLPKLSPEQRQRARAALADPKTPPEKKRQLVALLAGRL